MKNHAIEELGKIAFVFSGGSMRIAFQAGALDVVTGAGIKPIYASGVSSGALSAGAVATNKVPELVEVVGNLETNEVFNFNVKEVMKKLIRFKLPESLLDNAPLLDLILSVITENPEQFKEREEKEQIIGKTLISSDIYYAVVVTNVQLSKSETFTNREERVLKNPAILGRAILASTSIPAIFPLVDMEESGKPPQYTDGDNLKFNPFIDAIEAECDTIFYFYTPHYPNPDKYYDNVVEIAMHMVMMAACQLHDPKEMLQEALASYNNRHGWASKSFFKRIKSFVRPKRVRLITILADETMIDFAFKPGAQLDKEQMKELIELGRKRAIEILQANDLL